jgi:dTDP-3,4-didehydro-2,6-dideoxy-alpha-D-glucose 3-reductase
MKKVRIGVLGCASIAKRLVIPAICSLNDKFKIVGIASRTKDKADDFASLFQTESFVGYDNLLDRADIEAVYVPLPTGLHEEWITKALEAGKHVIVEKSFAIDFESANKMIELARSKKLLLMENFMFRHHSQHKYIWQKIINNDLGQIRLFRSQFGFPPLDENNFRYDKILGGGSLLDAGAYTVNASLWFMGKEQEVSSSVLYFGDKNVDVYGNASLINSKGIVSQLSFGFDNFYQCNYEFWSSKGRLIVPKAFTPKPNETTNILFEKQDEIEKIEISPDNQFVNLFNDLYKNIVSNKYDKYFDDILVQSRILSDIRINAIKIQL